MRSVIVTGGSGFIGSHLVKHFKNKNHHVFNYDVEEGFDILDFKAMKQVFKDVEPWEVYHLAGSVHMGPAEEDPVKDYTVNVQGTLNVLKLCEKHGSRLLYTGTGASYGVGGYPQREDDYPKPSSNYGVSKLAAECYVRKWAWKHGVHGTITRFGSIYGLGRKTGPVNIFVNQAKKHRYVTVHGPGHSTRDFLNVKDAVKGLLLVMKRGVSGELYNVGSGVETSIVEVAWIINQISGAEIRHIPFKYMSFGLIKNVFDVSKVKALGYVPRVKLEDGIRELWNSESG